MSDLNDSLRAFAKRPLGFKVAVFAGGIAVVGLLYYQLFYSDLSDRLADSKQINQTLSNKNRSLKQREQEYKQLVKQNDELKDTLRENRLSLPTSAELPSFFVHLQKQAAASGVNIQNWKRKNEQKIGGLYVKVPVEISVSGTFYQINRYFHLLSQTDRIITVENLSMGGASRRADETIMRATFLASTFRLAGGEAEDLYKSQEPEEADEQKSRAERIREARRKREQNAASDDGGDDETKAEQAGGAQ